MYLMLQLAPIHALLISMFGLWTVLRIDEIAAASALAYDSTAYIECLPVPEGVLYEGRGGMISDPDFEDMIIVDEEMAMVGAWTPFGGCHLQLRQQHQQSRVSGDMDHDVDSTSNLRRMRKNTFLAAVNRSHSFSGPSMRLPDMDATAITSDTIYALSAWVQVNHPGLEQEEEEAVPVKATVKATVVVEFFQPEDTSDKDAAATERKVEYYVSAGTVNARSGCWSFLKGGFSLDHIVGPAAAASLYATSMKATLYFEPIDFTHGMELWLDNVALQSFRNEEWLSHRTASMETLRRRSINLQLHLLDEEASSAEIMVHDAKLSRVEVLDTSFKFGAAMDEHILQDDRYQRWFMARFNMAVFENEMKWSATEKEEGRVDYNLTDAMLKLCQENRVGVRGHCIFWEDPTRQPPWLLRKRLEGGSAAVRQAAEARLASLVGHYSGGRVLHWDVSNELLHFSFLEDATVDPSASAGFFLRAHSLDPSALLFLNDYNTLEHPDDVKTTPDAYIARIQQLQEQAAAAEGGTADSSMANYLAIGLEAHFARSPPPNLAYMRAALDKLGATGLPVWLTELDIDLRGIDPRAADSQAEPSNSNSSASAAAHLLESILEEALSHPAVSGILLWAAWHPAGRCYRMCLTDADMVNFPVGDAVDRVLQKWRHVDILPAKAAAVSDVNAQRPNGGPIFSWRGPVGTYRVTLQDSHNATYSATFVVDPGSSAQHIHLFLRTST